jgi:CHASE3 domain sensor protein
VILKMEDVSNMKGKIIGSFGVLWLFLIVVVLAAVWRFAPTYNVRAEEKR